LNEIRATASENLSKLPETYKRLIDPPAYPVEISQALERLIEKLKRKLTKTKILGSSGKGD
jgi:hypothetical protein